MDKITLVRIMKEPQDAPSDADIEFNEEDFPLRLNCYRYFLPRNMQELLREHILSRDLYPIAAGFYANHARRHVADPMSCRLLYYCTGGATTFHTDSGNWPVAPGDLVVLPPDFSYVIDSSKSMPWTFYWVAYKGEMGAAFERFLNVSRLVTHIGLDPELIAEFEALCALRSSNFALDTLICGANRFRGLLARISLVISRDAQRERGLIDLNQIRRLMEDRLNGALTLNELAQAANFSPSHFSRAFKKLAGVSPMRYFLQMRIQQACHLLDTSREPVSQIAYAVGYDDPLYFSRIFRKVVGLSPQAYRKWGSKAML